MEDDESNKQPWTLPLTTIVLEFLLQSTNNVLFPEWLGWRVPQHHSESCCDWDTIGKDLTTDTCTLNSIVSSRVPKTDPSIFNMAKLCRIQIDSWKEASDAQWSAIMEMIVLKMWPYQNNRTDWEMRHPILKIEGICEAQMAAKCFS
jgi:hypothetical protein